MRPRNETAEHLLSQLAKLNLQPLRGFFGGATYCVGVYVESQAEAFKLGAMLGDKHGMIGMDSPQAAGMSHSRGAVITFRDALISP